MTYDVFISYSRKDKEKTESLCAALEKAGISYWIDRNIHGSANFLSEITAYIKGCKVVVFVASANSANSEWTQKEILYALKRSKEIVPYRIGTFRFEDNDELDFVFTNVQWVESERAVVESLKKLGCLPQPKPTPIPQPKPVPTPIPQPKPAPAKTYKVGDYYDDGKKQGVVFEVTPDGKHGKIVSLQEGRCLSWAVNRNFDTFYNLLNPSEKLIGADDKHIGSNNMPKVWKIAGWREKYPAFAWCADLGEGWYIPAIEELIKFTLDDDVRNAVNRTLVTKGKQIANIGDYHCYWSSTEYNEFCAWYVLMHDGSIRYYSKYYDDHVRAVSAF
jgi:hypothetical protein